MQEEWEADDDGIDWQNLWTTIIRRKWTILSLAFVSTLLTTLIVFAMTPMYSAVALVHIQAEQANIVSIEEIYGVDTRRSDYYETQAEIMRSRPIAARVVDTMGPPTLADSAGPLNLGSYLGSHLRSLLPFQAPEPPGGAVALDAQEADIEDYLDGLWIDPIRNTQLVQVGYVSPDPREAAAYANAHAAAYIESILDARLAVNESATNWMSKRVDELRDNLRESETRLQQFREQEKLIDVQGYQALPNLEVNDLTARLVEAKRELSITGIAYDQVYGNKSSAIESVPAVLENSSVQQFRAIQALAEQQVAELRERYGPKHPKMIAAQSELAEATQNLESQQQDVVGGIRAKYLAAQSEVNTLETELSNSKEQYQEVSRKGSDLASLQSEVETNRELFELFYNRMREMAQTGDLESVNARIVESAIAPRWAFKPNKGRAVITAFALSLIVGIGAAFLLENLNNTIRIADDIENHIGLPLIGMVPMLKGRSREKAAVALLKESDSVFGERIRTIRTRISLSNPDNPQKTILVTSSIGSEGKSTVALNLAMSFSQLERVLLIDADMRRPSLAQNLELDRSHPGLSELLSKQADIGSCIAHRKGFFKLDILTTGLIPPDPLQLLSSTAVANLFRSLREDYDRIIIDSPPILPVSDAAVLSKHADAVLYVIKADATSVQQIRSGLGQLQRFNAPVIGVVLNQFDLRKAESFGDFSYGVDYYDDAEKAKAAPSVKA